MSDVVWSRSRATRISWSVRKLFTNGAVKAGVLAGATYPADMLTNAATGEQVPDSRAGLPVAVIAMALEYGHGQHHPRPALHNTVVNRGKEWSAALTALIKQGVPVAEALLTVGQIMKEDIQETIRTWPADNSESWAQFKGFNHGDILTGHFMNSIESEVEMGDK